MLLVSVIPARVIPARTAVAPAEHRVATRGFLNFSTIHI
jgi:hypothetical protein